MTWDVQTVSILKRWFIKNVCAKNVRNQDIPLLTNTLKKRTSNKFSDIFTSPHPNGSIVCIHPSLIAWVYPPPRMQSSHLKVFWDSLLMVTIASWGGEPNYMLKNPDHSKMASFWGPQKTPLRNAGSFTLPLEGPCGFLKIFSTKKSPARHANLPEFRPYFSELLTFADVPRPVCFQKNTHL